MKSNTNNMDTYKSKNCEHNLSYFCIDQTFVTADTGKTEMWRETEGQLSEMKLATWEHYQP